MATCRPNRAIFNVLLTHDTNCYLHWLDKLFHAKDGPGTWANARIVRYADDFLIMARYVSQRMLDWMAHLLEDRMGLTINRTKTRTVHVTSDGSEGLDFLGYTFRYVVLRLHERVRELTAKRLGFIPPRVLVAQVNRYLTGWCAYFNQGHRGKIFSSVDYFTTFRLMKHFQRRSHHGLRPPEDWSWYRLLTEQLGYKPVGGSCR